MADRKFTVIVEFRVTDRTDAHLTSRTAIEAEIVSWLTDLRAEVDVVEVEEEKR